jgi:hypothetical protein
MLHFLTKQLRKRLFHLPYPSVFYKLHAMISFNRILRGTKDMNNMKAAKYCLSTIYLQQQQKGCQSGQVMDGSHQLLLS